MNKLFLAFSNHPFNFRLFGKINKTIISFKEANSLNFERFKLKLLIVAATLLPGLNLSAQGFKIKLIPLVSSSVSYYNYSNNNTLNIKYPYQETHDLSYHQLDIGMALELEHNKNRVGISYESSSIDWAIDGAPILTHEKQDTANNKLFITREYTKPGGYWGTTARRGKIYYNREIYRFDFDRYKNLLNQKGVNTKNRSFRLWLTCNVGFIRKVIEGSYIKNEFDEIYNLSGTTTRFVAQSQVLRQNTISTGLGFVFSQYYKEKERWKLIITYDQGYSNILYVNYSIYESGALIHSNTITNKGSELYVGIGFPIYLYKK